MTLSGWCTAPAGARPQHTQCRSLTCTCPCHAKGRDAVTPPTPWQPTTMPGGDA